MSFSMSAEDPVNERIPHLRRALSRRDFLFRAGSGFGGLALASLLAEEAQPIPQSNPMAPRNPHFRPRPKSVIFLFMVDGPSHMETFDPKPELDKIDGQPLPK